MFELRNDEREFFVGFSPDSPKKRDMRKELSSQLEKESGTVFFKPSLHAVQWSIFIGRSLLKE